MIQSNNLLSHSTHREIIVYDIPGYNAIRFISGNKCILLVDSALFAEKNKLKFHALPHAIKLGIEEEKVLYPDSTWKKILFGGTSILLSGKAQTGEEETDFLFIKNKVDSSTLAKIQCKKVLISSSLDQREIKRLSLFYRKKKIPYYPIIEYGAFQLSL